MAPKIHRFMMNPKQTNEDTMNSVKKHRVKLAWIVATGILVALLNAGCGMERQIEQEPEKADPQESSAKKKAIKSAYQHALKGTDPTEGYKEAADELLKEGVD